MLGWQWAEGAALPWMSIFPCNVLQPDLSTMASFTALVHVEPNRRREPGWGGAAGQASTLVEKVGSFRILACD